MHLACHMSVLVCGFFSSIGVIAAPLKIPKHCEMPFSEAEVQMHLRQAGDRLAWVILHKGEIKKKLVRGEIDAQIDTQKVKDMLKSCAEQISQGSEKCGLHDKRDLLNFSGRSSEEGEYHLGTIAFWGTISGIVGAIPAIALFGQFEHGEIPVMLFSSIGPIAVGSWAALVRLQNVCNDHRWKALKKLSSQNLNQMINEHFFGVLKERGIAVPSKNREQWLKDQLGGIQEIPALAYEGREGLAEEIKDLKLWMSREITHQRDLKHDATAQMLEEFQAKIPQKSQRWKFWESPKKLQADLKQIVEIKNDLMQLERDSRLSKKGVHLMDLIVSQDETEALQEMERRQKIWSLLDPPDNIKARLQFEPLDNEIEKKLLKLAEHGWKVGVETHASVKPTHVNGVLDVTFKLFDPQKPERNISIPLELPHKKNSSVETTLNDSFHTLVPRINEELADELKFVELNEAAKVPKLVAPKSYKLKLKNSEGCKIQLQRTLEQIP